MPARRWTSRGPTSWPAPTTSPKPPSGSWPTATRRPSRSRRSTATSRPSRPAGARRPPAGPGTRNSASATTTTSRACRRDFGAAAQQSFGIIGIEATGNSVKRKAGLRQRLRRRSNTRIPLSRRLEPLRRRRGAGAAATTARRSFNSLAGDGRAGGALNDGPTQWRMARQATRHFNQEGDGARRAEVDQRPADRERPGRMEVPCSTRGRRWGWGSSTRRCASRRTTSRTSTRCSSGVVAASLRDQGRSAPLPRAPSSATTTRSTRSADGVTDKSKNLAGLRSYVQYSLTPKLNLFNGAGLRLSQGQGSLRARRPRSRSGKDRFGEFLLGVNWQFRKTCAVRAQWVYTRNNSNIDHLRFQPQRGLHGRALRDELGGTGHVSAQKARIPSRPRRARCRRPGIRRRAGPSPSSPAT